MEKWDHIHFESIDSTNNWSKANICNLDREKITVVTTDEQTAGRGRYERRWLSPKQNNLYASFCFFIKDQRLLIEELVQISALSAAHTLSQRGFDPKLKWPNDLMINNKKIGGILCETLPADETTAIIMGIGINVNMAKEFLKKIDQPATSLYEETGRVYDTQEILNSLCQHFTDHLSSYFTHGITPFVTHYRQLQQVKAEG